jgi:hypothetical protein
MRCITARHLVMWTCSRNEVKQVQKRLQEVEYLSLWVWRFKVFLIGLWGLTWTRVARFQGRKMYVSPQTGQMQMCSICLDHMRMKSTVPVEVSASEAGWRRCNRESGVDLWWCHWDEIRWNLNIEQLITIFFHLSSHSFNPYPSKVSWLILA